MKKILLIGGCGYIGSRLYQHLISKNFIVRIVDIGWFGINQKNVLNTDYRNLNESFIKEYDSIVLLAGHSSVKMCDIEIQNSWVNNVSNFVGLVEKMSKNQQLIYASSGSVYGISGSHIFQPVNNYDITKYVLDLESEKLIGKGYNLVGLRFGTVNGASLNLRCDLMINSMFRSATENKQITINNKNVKRPLLAISDLCNAIETIINKEDKISGIFDLYSFNDRVIDIALDVSDATNAKIVETEDRDGVYDYEMKSTQFQTNFNFTFTGNRKSIIQELIEWMHKMKYGDRSVPRKYS